MQTAQSHNKAQVVAVSRSQVDFETVLGTYAHARQEAGNLWLDASL